MGRSRRRCEERVTITSGSIFRNVNTDFIEVAIENITFCPQTITVSILNQQNTCNGTEFPKYGYLCGDLVNRTSDGTISTSNTSECELFYPPEGVTPVLTPFTFTIPPRQLFIVRAWPTDPFIPQEPYYKVQVTYPTDPFQPLDPIRPQEPVRPIIVNTWGISSAGVIQAGNTVLHGQFRFQPGDPHMPVDPI